MLGLRGGFPGLDEGGKISWRRVGMSLEDGCVRRIMGLIGSWGRGSLIVIGGRRGGGRGGRMGGVIDRIRRDVS